MLKYDVIQSFIIIIITIIIIIIIIITIIVVVVVLRACSRFVLIFLFDIHFHVADSAFLHTNLGHTL